MGTEAGDQALGGEPRIWGSLGMVPGKRQGDLDLKPLALPPAPGFKDPLFCPTYLVAQWL